MRVGHGQHLLLTRRNYVDGVFTVNFANGGMKGGASCSFLMQRVRKRGVRNPPTASRELLKEVFV